MIAVEVVRVVLVPLPEGQDLQAIGVGELQVCQVPVEQVRLDLRLVPRPRLLRPRPLQLPPERQVIGAVLVRLRELISLLPNLVHAVLKLPKHPLVRIRVNRLTVLQVQRALVPDLPERQRHLLSDHRDGVTVRSGQHAAAHLARGHHALVRLRVDPLEPLRPHPPPRSVASLDDHAPVTQALQLPRRRETGEPGADDHDRSLARPGRGIVAGETDAEVDVSRHGEEPVRAVHDGSVLGHEPTARLLDGDVRVGIGSPPAQHAVSHRDVHPEVGAGEEEAQLERLDGVVQSERVRRPSLVGVVHVIRGVEPGFVQVQVDERGRGTEARVGRWSTPGVARRSGPVPLGGPLAVVCDGVRHQLQTSAVFRELVLEQAPLVVLTHLEPRAGLPGEVVAQRGAHLLPSSVVAHRLVPAPGDNLPVHVPEVERVPAELRDHQDAPVELLLKERAEFEHERVVVSAVSVPRRVVQPRALVGDGVERLCRGLTRSTPRGSRRDVVVDDRLRSYAPRRLRDCISVDARIHREGHAAAMSLPRAPPHGLVTRASSESDLKYLEFRALVAVAWLNPSV